MERRVLPPLAVTVAALLLLQVFSISPGAATPRRFQIGSKQQERPEPEPIEEWAVCSTADGPGFISRIEAKFGLTYCGPVSSARSVLRVEIYFDRAFRRELN